MGLSTTSNSIGPMPSTPVTGGVTPLSAAPVSKDVTQEEIADNLARYVRNCFIEAEMYRRINGVEERLLQALRARRYVYDPQEAPLVGQIDVYIGLTALKCRAAEAWINDILLSSIEKPWTLDATPIPNLPEWMKEQVVDALELEMQQMGIPFDLRQRAKELKDVAHKFAVDQAKIAVGKMETKIEDQMDEGGWVEAFSEFLSDFCTFPAAFLRSPTIENKLRLEWNGSKLEQQTDTIFGVRRISPFDAYPAPNSTTPRNGRYFIERRKLEFDMLYDCISLPGFREEAIRELLNKYLQTGYEEILRPDFQRKFLQDTYETPMDRKTLDTLIFNGKVPGKFLMDNDILVKDIDAQYECEIWTVNNEVIMAVLNPYPLHQRPIFGSSFVKVPGALWGEGLADILRPLQRVVNSCARAIVRNMAYSSGPIGEVDTDRLAPGEIPDEIWPYKLYHVESDPTGKAGPAYKFQIIPTVVPELMQVWEKFKAEADDLSGVPPYVMGNMNVAGAGRTMGGLSMLMANAAKGIKNSILNVDRDVISPSIQLRYQLNMLYDDDPDIKADAQVIAKGATGLLQRELSQARLVEMLQMLTPYAISQNPQQPPLIPREGMQIILREILKTSGLPVDDIIPNSDPMNSVLSGLGAAGGNPEQIASLMQGMAGGSPSTANPLQTGSSATPQLDARSSVPSAPGSLPPPTAPNVNPQPTPLAMPTGP